MDSIIHQLENETLTCLHVSNLGHSSLSSSCSHVISLRYNSMTFTLKVLWCFFVTRTPCRAEGPSRCLLLLVLLPHPAHHLTLQPADLLALPTQAILFPVSRLCWGFPSLAEVLFIFFPIGSYLAKLHLEIWKNRYTNYTKLWTLS